MRRAAGVYEWWHCPCSQSSDGFWRRVHPEVCQRLDQAWWGSEAFRGCQTSLGLPGGPERVKVLSHSFPFDPSGPDREFDPGLVITEQHPRFSQRDRLLGRCMVLYHPGCPERASPARRRRPMLSAYLSPARGGERMCQQCMSDEPSEAVSCETDQTVYFVCERCQRQAVRDAVCGCLAPRGTLPLACVRAGLAGWAVAADGWLAVLLEQKISVAQAAAGVAKANEALGAVRRSAMSREWFAASVTAAEQSLVAAERVQNDLIESRCCVGFESPGDYSDRLQAWLDNGCKPVPQGPAQGGRALVTATAGLSYRRACDNTCGSGSCAIA